MKVYFSLTIVLVVCVKLAIAQPTELPGFPISYDAYQPRDRGCVIEDLTGDGKPEIIVVGAEPGLTRSTRLYIYNSDGSDPLYTLQMFDIGTDPLQIGELPVVGDIDGDGDKDLVVSAWIRRTDATYGCPFETSGGLCWHNTNNGTHFSTILATWEFENGAPINVVPEEQAIVGVRMESLAMGDIDGDGAEDIAGLGEGFSGTHRFANETSTWNWGNTMHAHRWNGNNWQTLGAEGVGYCPSTAAISSGYSISYGSCALGDIDFDGDMEVFALFAKAQPPEEGRAELYIYDYVGSSLQHHAIYSDELQGRYLIDWPGETGYHQSPGPVLGDLNKDGYVEAVFCVSLDTQTPTTWQLAIVDDHNQDVRFHSITPAGWWTEGPQAISIADIQDGLLQPEQLSVYLSVKNPSGSITGFRRYSMLDGHIIANGWPKELAPIDAFYNNFYTPAIAVTDSDNELKLVTHSYQLNNNTIRHFGTTGGSDLVWSAGPTTNGASKYLSTSQLSDLDHDGDAELVTVTSYDLNESRIHAYDLGIPASPDQWEWQGFRNGSKHTGLYAQPVTGLQQSTSRTWSDRIIIHDSYTINYGQTLIIEPGTTIELRPEAYLLVYGTLDARGSEFCPIYFKRDGTADWEAIYLMDAQSVSMEYCEIEGGTEVYIQGGDVNVLNCTFSDMDYGLNIVGGKREFLNIESNTITDCALYGIHGTTSAGIYSDNTIQNCGRAGIYWVGDLVGAASPSPFFQYNTVENCGGGTGGIAGAYFNSTTAELKCNTFRYNEHYQIYCYNLADVVMNGNLSYSAVNTLHDDATDVFCSCDPRCTCAKPPAGYSPLMRMYYSVPQLNSGFNVFRFDNDGTYLRDPCPSRIREHDIHANYFESNGTPNTGPFTGDAHWCGPFIGTPNQLSFACFNPFFAPLSLPQEQYRDAVSNEESGDSETALAGYVSIIENHPDTPEAQWSLNRYMNLSVVTELDPLGVHADLMTYHEDPDLPDGTQNAARRDAIWAQVAGQYYGDAHDELDEIVAVPGHEDSLWAEQMHAIVDFLDEPPTIFSTGDRQPDRSRGRDLHNRIMELQGRSTNEEVLDEMNAPVVKSVRLSKAYPNPFNSIVNIQLELPNSGLARVDVFNVLGRKIETLLDKPMNAGTHVLQWNANNAASGVYFYRMSFDDHVESHKMLLLK